MNYAERCFTVDEGRRAESGASAMGWVGINYVRPKHKHEKKALKIVKERYPNGITIHVYDVVQLVADLIKDGIIKEV